MRQSLHINFLMLVYVCVLQVNGPWMGTSAPRTASAAMHQGAPTQRRFLFARRTASRANDTICHCPAVKFATAVTLAIRYLEYDPIIHRDDGSCFLNRSYFYASTGICPSTANYPGAARRDVTA